MFFQARGRGRMLYTCVMLQGLAENFRENTFQARCSQSNSVGFLFLQTLRQRLD